MSESQCSYTHAYSSKFYDECESASENFLYRGVAESAKEENKGTKTRHRHTLIAEIKRTLGCCFGSRNGNRPLLYDFGVDLPTVFGNSNSQQSTPRGIVSRDDGDKVLWAIEASKEYARNVLRLSDARWVALSWVSKVANGETITYRVINSLVIDAQKAKNSIEAISKAVIKNFPGLQLADGISSFETVDHAMAIDAVMDYKNEHATLNRASFAIILKRNCCFALYFNNRGESCDLALLEVVIAGKHGSTNTIRMLAFSRLKHMRDYLMDIDALKTCTTLYCYTFNLKSLQYATRKGIAKCQIALVGGRSGEIDQTELEDKGKFLVFYD
ncbi:ferrous iron transport B, putative [Babesia ovis]|uniref:Ferrous iron transport B, putative n=1 Tax=Babesia ovis TaxID=5869 RepID=A0A9W5TDU7_BABOV|nr:ferrous iron transport B, putative [Babesia ovis]